MEAWGSLGCSVSISHLWKAVSLGDFLEMLWGVAPEAAVYARLPTSGWQLPNCYPAVSPNLQDFPGPRSADPDAPAIARCWHLRAPGEVWVPSPAQVHGGKTRQTVPRPLVPPLRPESCLERKPRVRTLAREASDHPPRVPGLEGDHPGLKRCFPPTRVCVCVRAHVHHIVVTVHTHMCASAV